jgi:hypothetical protein
MEIGLVVVNDFSNDVPNMDVQVCMRAKGPKKRNEG